LKNQQWTTKIITALRERALILGDPVAFYNNFFEKATLSVQELDAIASELAYHLATDNDSQEVKLLVEKVVCKSLLVLTIGPISKCFSNTSKTGGH